MIAFPGPPPRPSSPVSAPDLSLVVPLYNEVENLEDLAREIRAALEPTARSWESIFVDDGSTDGSLELLRRLAAADPSIRVVRHARNAGQSARFTSPRMASPIGW